MELNSTQKKVIIVFLVMALLVGGVLVATVITDPGSQGDVESKKTIGYWEGVYHDEQIEELEGSRIHKDDLYLVKNRAIARLEVIRGEPMQEDVELKVRSREEFRQDNPFQIDNASYKDWIDTIWFGQLIIPGQIQTESVSADLRENRTLAYYLISEETLVLIVEPDDQGYVKIDEKTLVHELTHAMQDQRIGLNNEKLNSKETVVRQGQLSLVEGEARLVEELYEERCVGGKWSCPSHRIQTESLEYDMPGFRATSLSVYEAGETYMINKYQQGGWEAIDAAYTQDPPLSMYDILYPNRENPDKRLVVSDISRKKWTLYSGQGYNGQDSLGPVGISSMVHHFEMKYSIDTDVEDPVVYTGLDNKFQYNDGLSEDLRYDGIQPYSNSEGSVGFVWVLVWEDPQSANKFTNIYSNVLTEKGGSLVEDKTYTFSSESLSEHGVYQGPAEFQGYFSVARNEEMVVITYGPSQEALNEIRPTRLEPVTLKEYSTVQYEEPNYTIISGQENAKEVRSDSPLQSYLTIILVVLLAIGYLIFVGQMD